MVFEFFSFLIISIFLHGVFLLFDGFMVFSDGL